VSDTPTVTPDAPPPAEAGKVVMYNPKLEGPKRPRQYATTSLKAFRVKYEPEGWIDAHAPAADAPPASPVAPATPPTATARSGARTEPQES
jgi:hypothetical protein